MSVLLGLPAYFVSFLVAFGGETSDGKPRDSLHNYVTFTVMIAIYAVVVGLFQVFIASPYGPKELARRAAFGVLACLALNSAAIGIGSIVSARHKDENSVSANFSTTTDVLVATSLLLAAIVFAACALRVSPYKAKDPRHSQWIESRRVV